MDPKLQKEEEEKKIRKIQAGKYKLFFDKTVYKFFAIYKVICNYLHLNACNASGSGLPQLPCLLHIQQSPHCFGSQNKKTTSH